MALETEAAWPFPANERWPRQASVLGGAHARLILEALNDPALVSEAGWYTDSPHRGPVWHRWAGQLDKELSPQVGLAFLGALYGLASRGEVEFTTGPRAKLPRVHAVATVSAPGRADSEGAVENAILSFVRGRAGIAIGEVLGHVIPNGRWGRRKRQEAWLRDRGIPLHGEHGGSAQVIAALDLAIRFVELETGAGLTDPQADDLEDLLSGLEIATFQHLEN